MMHGRGDFSSKSTIGVSVGNIKSVDRLFWGKQIKINLWDKKHNQTCREEVILYDL